MDLTVRTTWSRDWTANEGVCWDMVGTGDSLAIFGLIENCFVLTNTDFPFADDLREVLGVSNTAMFLLPRVVVCREF